MLKIAALKLAGIVGDHTFRCMRRTQTLSDGKSSPEHVRRRQIAQSQSRWREWVLVVAILGGFPSIVSATHEADHRFTVEGFVCGADGKGSANIDVLVKDTKISYGQIVKTDGDGYYKAAFHLHNDNLGDPLLIEANGQQQQQKVSFDPKDLESERIILVNFGTGCMQDRGSPPLWVYLGSGTVAAAVGGFIGFKLIRSWRKQEQRRGKAQGKRKK
jgi:hypothetical protein